MKQKLIQKKILFIVFLFIPLSYLYSQDIDPIQSKLENIADDIYLVTNIRGGNVAVLIGEDSTLVVDTGSSADDVERIQSAISELNDLPIHLVVNTHWHSDHVGGNEKMNELGALIIAHENVKKRMQKEQFLQFLDRTIPKASEKSLPHQTFTKNLNLDFQNNDIQIFQVEPGHSDSDAIVFFKTANVIHMGDLFFNGLYPYICISSGGSINGVISVIYTILPRINEKTVVIPGHGPLSNKAELIAYVTMLAAIRDRIQPQIEAGKTLEEIVASKPTKEFDDPWGKMWLKADDFVRLVYMDLIR